MIECAAVASIALSTMASTVAGLGVRRFFDYLEIFHDRQRRHTSLGMADAVRVRGSPSANDSGMKPKDPPTVSS